ncbi:MAG: VWA domain-containing protein [Treponema sp.]|nr:VWA domain-containing protein [Treponema sp.]
MKRRLLSILILFAVAFGFAAEKDKLSIKIDQVVSKDYPNMTAFVSVKNEKGETVNGLAPGLFKTRIDSEDLRGRQSVYQFSMKTEPVDYTILISNNGIMEGEPLDFQKNALIQFIDYMQKDETLSLYTIGDDAVPIFENQKKETIDTSLINDIQLSEVQPRIYDSLMNVIRKSEQKSTRRKVIIILSDGRDQNSRFIKEQLDSTLTEKSIPVYSVGFRVLSSAGLSALNQVSEVSSGTYVYSDISKIPDSLKSVKDIITKCYVIDYKIKNVKPDNSFHLMEVSVSERDSEGRGQKTFFALKLPVPKWLKILIIICAVVLIAVLVVLFIISKIQIRKAMGITKRRCPVCGNRMKDSWDYCPFCKYLPDIKKKKKKNK